MQVNIAVPARQEQILRATVEVIAEVGYHATSFARIIDHAQLSSTRLISYHFKSRDDLMRAALDYVIAQAQAFMQPRISRATTAPAKLAAYIRSNLEFLADDRASAVAAVQIASNLPAGSEDRRLGRSTPDDFAVVLLAQLFRQGQAAGEMRDFDPDVMAVTVRAAIDAAVLRATADQVDLRAYAEELVQLFEHATGSESRS